LKVIGNLVRQSYAHAIYQRTGKQPIILTSELAPLPALVRAELHALPLIIRARDERANRRFIEVFIENPYSRSMRAGCARG